MIEILWKQTAENTMNAVVLLNEKILKTPEFVKVILPEQWAQNLTVNIKVQ